MTSESAQRATPATVFDLGGFSLSDMVRCGAELRAAAAVAADTRAATEHTVRYLHGSFVDEATGGSAFALLRMWPVRATTLPARTRPASTRRGAAAGRPSHAIRWGTRPEKAGKVVWAELSHPRA